MTTYHRILSALGVAGALSPAVPAVLHAQDDVDAGLGIEFQVYPSGGIFTARGSIALDDDDVLFGHLGYNLADRGSTPTKTGAVLGLERRGAITSARTIREGTSGSVPICGFWPSTGRIPTIQDAPIS